MQYRCLAIAGRKEKAIKAAREDLKAALLSLIGKIDDGDAGPQPDQNLKDLVEALTPLSPIPDPINHPSAVSGGWINLYAKFGSGRSQGKSNHDDSTLGLQSFRAFPDIPVHIVKIHQEIGTEPNAYNNVVLFETLDSNVSGTIIIHGTYERDDDPKRFRIVFYGAEIRPRDTATAAELRQAVGLGEDETLIREFKPAKLYSDIVYLDETIRINLGGMGGVYVLERSAEPAISL